MKRISTILALALVATLFVVSPVSAQSTADASQTKAMPAMAKEKSLYLRLGGYNAVAAVTDDFLGRLIMDQQFTRFFGGASDDSKKKLRQHVVDLLCMVTGG